MDGDRLEFLAEDGPDDRPEPPPWKILVVDDDEQVHHLTRLTLDKFRYRGRALEILSAHTAAEAREVMVHHPDVAVVLLDVVMETDDAGLRLARWVRDEANNRAVRIILRTGVPGQAPEQAVIADFDINDYLEKSDVTVQRLYTAITTALRSYEDIRELERARYGLQEVIASTAGLHHLHSVSDFGEAVVQALLRHLGQAGPAAVPAAVYVGEHTAAGVDPDTLHVLFGTPDKGWKDMVQAAAAREVSVFDTDRFALFAPVPDGSALVLAAGLAHPLCRVEQELLEVFASQVASAFAIVRLTEELERRVAERTKDLEAANARLREIAFTDYLTGALSRRRLMEAAATEVERVKRYGGDLSVILFDLDRFKDLNDTYGHKAGDEVLCEVVRRCRTQLRDVDYLGRFGGEEFAVLLPETPRVAAVEVAERLRQVIAETVMVADGRRMAVSISAGVAAYRAGEANIESALRRADDALYEAKRAGRNQVKVG